MLGAVATVLAGLRSLGRWEENRVAWAQSRAAIEREIVFFDVGVEPYRERAAAAAQLTLRVQDTVSRETATWAFQQLPEAATRAEG